MREIKFRAWDKEKKVMLFMSDGSFSNHRIWWLETNDCQDRYILMQFTGLKDKNGKEIYEGDKVMASSLYGWKTPRIVDEFGLNIRNMSDGNLEVIGNIHQELIEGKEND